MSLTGTEASGTSSYQTAYVARPPAVQSDSVPICSSPCEVSEKPPSPTQNVENRAGPALQFAAGCTQVPDTLVYVTGAAGSGDATAYPAQFELVEVAALASATGIASAAAAMARSARS